MKARRFLKGLAIGSVLRTLAVAAFLLRFPPDPLTLCQTVIDSGFEQWRLSERTRGVSLEDGIRDTTAWLREHWSDKSKAG